MTRPLSPLGRLFLFGLLLLGLAGEARAQSHAQTARAFVQAPQVLGMGGAGAALPARSTVFFYNPAHLAQAALARPQITVLGLHGAARQDFAGQVAFYRDELGPAIDEGFDNIDAGRRERLYDEARRLGRAYTFVSSNVLLPSVTLHAGGVGLGGGAFLHGLTRYRIENGGAGVPVVNHMSQLDVIALAASAVDLSRYGAHGLSVGLAGKYVRRHLALKQRPIDGIDRYYLLEGSSVGLDLGLYYAPALPLPGTLTAGLAVYDALATDFGYQYNPSGFPHPWLQRFGADLAASEEAGSPRAIEREVALANERYALHPSYRLGLAYAFAVPLRGLSATSLALDYVGYAEPAVDQSFLAHFRLGLKTRVGRVLSLRTGLNQGYPTLGAGLDLSFVQVDYAYYGFEGGRLPGQVPNWNHTLQLAFGLF